MVDTQDWTLVVTFHVVDTQDWTLVVAFHVVALVTYMVLDIAWQALMVDKVAIDAPGQVAPQQGR